MARVYIQVPAELTVHNRQDIKGKILDHINSGVYSVMLNFAENKYIDSSGLGMLLTLRRKLVENGGDLTICNPSDDFARLLRRVKLDVLFHIEHSDEIHV